MLQKPNYCTRNGGKAYEEGFKSLSERSDESLRFKKARNALALISLLMQFYWATQKPLLFLTHACFKLLLFMQDYPHWIAYRPRFVGMTQHWVGRVCAEFGWNLLRFGSKGTTAVLWFLYECVSLPRHMCHTGHWALHLCGLPSSAEDREAEWVRKEKKKKHIIGRESCKASSVWGIKTDKHTKGSDIWLAEASHTDSGNWKVFVADTVRTEAQCLKEKHTASKQTVTAISLLWNVK